MPSSPTNGNSPPKLYKQHIPQTKDGKIPLSVFANTRKPFRLDMKHQLDTQEEY